MRQSTLTTNPELIPNAGSGSWSEFFRSLALLLPDKPSIVVLDELPWLAQQDPTFDGALQEAWDRMLSRRPVLLLLLGSDIHMMERFTSYDRPFYGRATTLVLRELNLADTAAALGLSGSDAIDAQLVSGGLPGILQTWPQGMPALDFMQKECENPISMLFNVPEYTLLSEFPNPDRAKRVLEAIGSGDRTSANIAATAGSSEGAMPSGALSPTLKNLVEQKRVVTMEQPLSTQPGKPPLYHVSDTNLRLYLNCLREAQQYIRRGRSKQAFSVIQRNWTIWRGRAVEPLIRQSLENAAFDGKLPWPDTRVVGGWWNRQFNPEIDLVGADRGPIAKDVYFAGSVKWLGTPYDNHDHHELLKSVSQLPGATRATGIIVVSRSGISDIVYRNDVDVIWGPDDILSAWT
jgi:hypothetical protein